MDAGTIKHAMPATFSKCKNQQFKMSCDQFCGAVFYLPLCCIKYKITLSWSMSVFRDSNDFFSFQFFQSVFSTFASRAFRKGQSSFGVTFDTEQKSMSNRTIQSMNHDTIFLSCFSIETVECKPYLCGSLSPTPWRWIFASTNVLIPLVSTQKFVVLSGPR